MARGNLMASHNGFTLDREDPMVSYGGLTLDRGTLWSVKLD